MNQLQQQKQQRAQQTMQQQRQDVYIQPTQITAASLELEKNEEKHGLASVRAVVESLMPHAYDRVDLMRSASAADLRKSVLHHARGTELLGADGTDDVLEFDMAGSSFQTPRSDYAGFKGKGTAVGADGKAHKVARQLKISWYNRLRAHLWIPGVRSPDEIEAENQRRLAVDPIYQRFGASQIIDNVTHEHVRKKVEGHKTRVTIAGAQTVMGMSNSGEYSIENTRGYMLAMGKSYLEPILDSWRGGAAPRDIHLLVRGHSRGGVSAVEGAMMLKKWVADSYPPEYLDYLKFELVQMDPVPGLGSRFGVNKRVDLSGTEALTKGGDNMLPLGANAETTVMYSLHTEHTDAFTPQAVIGAKRVILMVDKHHVSLNQTDRGIVQHGDGTNEVKSHRAVFTDAESGEAYRGSGISQLGEGVYIADEANTLIRLTSYEQAQQVIAGVLNGNKWHAERHAVINEVVKAWFDAHAAPGAPGGNA